jgi:hypothetical protein
MIQRGGNACQGERHQDLEQQGSPPVMATVRVCLAPEQRASAVVLLPYRKPINFDKGGPSVQFHLEPFERLAMALVEYP